MPKNPPWESKPGAGAAGGSKGKTTGGRAAVAAEPAGPSAATPAAAAGAVGSETDNGEVSVRRALCAACLLSCAMHALFV